MDLKGVFNSEPKSLFEAVSESGVCFYLPAYQRPYAWSKKNVERVFEDVLHGIENNIRNEDAITFIGTILAIHDTKYQTIKPFKRGEVPAKVMLIIDGQQRLTTMMLIMMALHEGVKLREKKLQKEISRLEKELSNSPDNQSIKDVLESKEWLLDKINQESANLRHFSTDTNSTKSKVFRWYPKIIRAYQDCWSKTEDGAEYNSPIARALHAYNSHLLACEESGDFKPFKYEVDKNLANADKHEVLQKNLEIIRKRLVKIARGADEEDGGINLRLLTTSCFKEAFQFDVPELLLSETNLVDRETLNLIAFSKYFLNRVCVTYVTVTDEAYAFDMFEALNTTGEPLTSIETFKPKVIEEEGLGKYETSPSKQYMDLIDEVLEKISDPSEKHRQTDRIMLAFALSETGEKITKHISDQRRYLIKSYSHGVLERRRAFVRNLAHVTRFIHDEWDTASPQIINDADDEYNTVLLCLDFLRKAGHEVSIPIIERFYSEYKINQNPKNLKNLYSIVRTCAAFFALWRAAHRGTSGIDSAYRDVMKNGYPEFSLSPVARSSEAELDIEKIKTAFLAMLRNKVNEQRSGELKDSWVQLASEMPIYDTKEICRFILLCSQHDRWPSSSGDPLHLVEAAKGTLPMLSWHRWKLFFDEASTPVDKYTVEHVGPQTYTTEWDKSLDDRTLLNSIGNLTILPMNINASAGNSSWAKKREIYQNLCNQVRSQHNLPNGSQLSSSQVSMIRAAPYLGFLESVSKVETWNAEIVKRRSENLLSGAFDALYLWLVP
jgi:uncharacterized protein with ParB-like and HNH nuclease domain